MTDREQFGPYCVLSELGRGGQGTVYLAEDTRLGRQVALKVLSGRGSAARSLVIRFRREAAVAAKLQHPGICAVHEADVVDDVPYIAMQLVKGESLSAKIARARDGDSTLVLGAPTEAEEQRTREEITQVELTEMLRLVEDTARALHAAHEVGVIHRDVKPGNIMVTHEGKPVVLDFGLARDDEDGVTLTQSGDFLGTPAYMSPEQLTRGGQLDRRTDVWSLGVTLYEGLTTRRPFEAPTREGLYGAIAGKEPTDPRTLNPAISRDLKVVIETALEKDLDRRYQTALDLAEDLRRVREWRPIAARPATTLTKLRRWVRRNPSLATSVFITLLTLLAGTIVSVTFGVRAVQRAREASEARSDKAAALDELEILSDGSLRLRALEREGRTGLWPANGGNILALEDWLARARALTDRLPKRRSQLRDLERHALPHVDQVDVERPGAEPDRVQALTEEARDLKELSGKREQERQRLQRALDELAKKPTPTQRDEQRTTRLSVRLAVVEDALASIGDRRALLKELSAFHLARASTPTGFRFADGRRRLLHGHLKELVLGLEQLVEDPSPGAPSLAAMNRRLERAREQQRISRDEATVRAWSDAINQIQRHEDYGFRMVRDDAFVPLGPDPDSGLWEFFLIGSGEPPERAPESGQWTILSATGMVFVLVPGGTFSMGAGAEPNVDAAAQQKEQPVHPVTLDPYLLSRYEMTQGQWLHVMGELPASCVSSFRKGIADRRHPVSDVTWHESREACRRLGVQIPTEAQWERACRADTHSVFSTGDTIRSLVGSANIAGTTFKNLGGLGETTPGWDDSWALEAPVGTFRPNRWGFHDVHGNVWEWCRDRFARYNAAACRPGDGMREVPANKNSTRITRGGSFRGTADFARSASRGGTGPDARFNILGLRPAAIVIQR